jgi:hypothetical protein
MGLPLADGNYNSLTSLHTLRIAVTAAHMGSSVSSLVISS